MPLCHINYKKIQGFRKVKGLGHKPLDTDAVLAAVQQTKAIITVEEHSIIGGLGSAVVEALTVLDCGGASLKMLGLPDAFCKEIGGQEYLQRINGLSVEDICDVVSRFYKSLGAKICRSS